MKIDRNILRIKKVGKESIKWSERRDLNPRPLVPQTSALPGCATLRSF
tara:strand:+ start:721 stop:864 length:144 start_codon:yes stop_codon:yes gene_type:complete